MDEFEECWEILGHLTPSTAEPQEQERQEHMVKEALAQILAVNATIFVEDGWLKVRAHDGTITTLAPV